MSTKEGTRRGAWANAEQARRVGRVACLTGVAHSPTVVVAVATAPARRPRVDAGVDVAAVIVAVTLCAECV